MSSIGTRPLAPRPVTIRMLVCQACAQLSTVTGEQPHEEQRLLQTVNTLRPTHESPVTMSEMQDLLDTEGTPQNGGGYFIVTEDQGKQRFVKHETGGNDGMRGSIGRNGVPGDIGSPVPGSAMLTFNGNRFGGPPGIASPSGF
jgi:hypothetical protein